MKLDPRTLLAVAAIVLTGYALYLLMRPSPALEVAEDAYRGPDGELVDARAAAELERRRLAAEAFGTRIHDDDDEALPLEASEVTPPPDDMAGPLTTESARSGFDYAMRRVEKLAQRRRLTQGQWDKLYREANDAYAALAIVLDAHDTRQAAELEEAHRRLKLGLAALRVRGDKFGP